MAMKQTQPKQKDKKSAVDTIGTGLGIAKTAYSLGSDVSDAFKGGTASTTGSAVDSTAWNQSLGVDQNLGVGNESLDRIRRRLSRSNY